MATSSDLSQINLNVDNATNLIFVHPDVKGGTQLNIRSGANQINWGYSLNTKIIPTYGGEVQQILSCRIDELTISGNTRDNHQLEEIHDYFRAYMTMASGFALGENGARSEVPITFSYPARSWQFNIQVIDAPSFQIGTGLVATEWSITAIIVPDGENVVHPLQEATMSDMTSVLLNPGIPIGIGYIDQNKYSENVPSGAGGVDLNAFGATIGENFQRLIGSESVGNFSQFAFDGAADVAANGLTTSSQDFWTSIYGSDQIQVATKTQTGSGSQSLGTDGAQGGSGTQGNCTAVSDNQNIFANALAAKTGIDFGFICAWMYAEEGSLQIVDDARHPGGDYNFLNVGQDDSGPTADANPANFSTPTSAAQFTFDWISDEAAPKIKAFLTEMPGLTAAQDITLLQQSGWATSGYPSLPQIYANTIQPALVITSGNNASGSSAAGQPTSGSVRSQAIGWANWMLGAANSQIFYSETIPPRIWAKPPPLPFSTDCSGAVIDCYLWAGARNVGAQATGSMVTNLMSITEANALLGDLVVIGSGSGFHAVMILSKEGDDWQVFSHGGPDYPDHPHTDLLHRDYAGNVFQFLRWPGVA